MKSEKTTFNLHKVVTVDELSRDRFEADGLH